MDNRKDHSHDDDIGCLQAIEAFYTWLDGELEDPESIAGFEHHLEHCKSCFSRAEMERALTAHIRRSSAKHAPATLKKRLRKLIDEF